MKITIIVFILIGIIAVLAVIFHTELLGEYTTYGECLVTVSGERGFSSSAEKSTSENQCKQSCISSRSIEPHENQNISCKFHTISGYGWLHLQ